MKSSQANADGKGYLARATEIGVHLLMIAVIITACYRIVSPFIMTVAWAVIIAIALNTPFRKLKDLVGGRNKLAGAIFIVVGLALVLVPTILLMGSIVEGTSSIKDNLEAGRPIVPPPSETVQTWPLIGAATYDTWMSAYTNTAQTLKKMEPQLKAAARRLARAAAGLGITLVQMLFAIVIAGILLITSASAGRTAQNVARALGGDKGGEMADMAAATIRSVVKGVLLVAMIQSLLAAVGMGIAGVPAAGLWALLVMMVAIVQLPPLLILGPVAVWLFSTDTSTGMCIFFLVYSFIVSVSDSFLKPLFLGRGVEVPMLVILIGAIGGMMRAGVIGLFVGAVILAIGYQLLKMWMEDENEQMDAADAKAPPTS